MNTKDKIKDHEVISRNEVNTEKFSTLRKYVTPKDIRGKKGCYKNFKKQKLYKYMTVTNSLRD